MFLMIDNELVKSKAAEWGVSCEQARVAIERGMKAQWIDADGILHEVNYVFAPLTIIGQAQEPQHSAN